MGNVQTTAAMPEALWRQAPVGELVDLGRAPRVPLHQLRLQRAPKGVLSRREGLLLGTLALLAHGAVIYWISQQPTTVLPVVPPQIPPMTIEFSQPAPRLSNSHHRHHPHHRRWSNRRLRWSTSWPRNPRPSPFPNPNRWSSPRPSLRQKPSSNPRHHRSRQRQWPPRRPHRHRPR